MKRILVPFLFLACNSYAAGIQKWTDENGQVYYGDSPPAQVTTEQIRISRPPSNPGKSLPRFNPSDNAQQEAGSEASSPKQADATPPEPSKQEASEFCAQARKDLGIINRSNRLRIKAADGSTRLMTSEEIDARRKQTEADIEQYCK